MGTSSRSGIPYAEESAVEEKGADSESKVRNRLFLFPAAIEVVKLVLATVGTPLKFPIHPVATRTDPLIL
jgi:hypothetical protein